jgi:hypothetical protein
VHDVSLYFLAVDHRNGQNGIEATGSKYHLRAHLRRLRQPEPDSLRYHPVSLQGPVPFGLSVMLSGMKSVDRW